MTIEGADKPIDCYPCHKECETCYGLESTQCEKCKTLTDYLNANKTLVSLLIVNTCNYYNRLLIFLVQLYRNVPTGQGLRR